MASKTRSLKDKILIAAVEGVGADTSRNFTIEDIAVWAWQRDRTAWGLRGYEQDHPDLDKVRKDMGARGAEQKGVVQLGWVERVEPRVYRLTPSGLAEYAAISSSPNDRGLELQEKASRELESEISRILQHPVFLQWLSDPSKPKYFRDAGHFWGIAPGTPATMVRERVGGIDNTLRSAMKLLDERRVDRIASSRGKALFDRTDIERCTAFQNALKKRFWKDLRILDPQFERAG
jgi:hypothetical protein